MGSSRTMTDRTGTWMIVVAICLLLATSVAVGQQPPTAKTPSPSVPATNPPDRQTPEKKPEHVVTPEEGKELFRSVDRILKFASSETDLPIRHEVKRELVNRDQVEAYIEHRMKEDEDVQRMQRSELVLKKFGLLPRDFDMRSFFLALLREQVAGYYDPKTKTVNLLNWVEPEVQQPVLAHELTHALQDQSFDLDHWLKGAAAEIKPADAAPKNGDSQKKKSGKDSEKKDESVEAEVQSAEVQSDEQQAARLAVVEGQAMLVLVDYMLLPTGQTVVTSPGVVDAIEKNIMVGDNSPIFDRAPLYLKASLTFSYRYGLDFERVVLSKQGKDAAFAGVMKHPPENEREVMEPAAYLAGEHLPALPLPNFDALLQDGYQEFDVGSFGEFDVSVLIQQFGSEDASNRLAPAWRGGYYYAAQRKGDSKGPLAVVYVSRWESPEDAQEFADIYAVSVMKRYRRADPVKPSKRLIAVSYAAKGWPGAQDEDDEGDQPKTTQWMTEDGRVIVERHGNLVLVMESFDQRSADQLRDAVLAADKSQK